MTDSGSFEGQCADLVDLMRQQLSPLAAKYGYPESPLERGLQWRPTVLFLGLQGADVSHLVCGVAGENFHCVSGEGGFSIVVGGATSEGSAPLRQGADIARDPSMPFDRLESFGPPFLDKLVLQTVVSERLKNMALIATPEAFWDSPQTGWDARLLLVELVRAADLVVVAVSAEKILEGGASFVQLLKWLPQDVVQHRIVFAMTGLARCASLSDLLRAHGQVCWRLSSQFKLAALPEVLFVRGEREIVEPLYLEHLPDGLTALHAAVDEAPRMRLQHLSEFVVLHSSRLSQMIDAFIKFGRLSWKYWTRLAFNGVFFALGAGCFAGGGVWFLGGVMTTPLNEAIGAGVVAVLLVGLGWWWLLMRGFRRRFIHRAIERIDRLGDTSSASKREEWLLVRDSVVAYLKHKAVDLRTRVLRSERHALSEAMSRAKAHAGKP